MIEAPKKTRDKLLMAVLYSYSRRLGEALMLNRNHINLRDKTIKFKFEKRESLTRNSSIYPSARSRQGKRYLPPLSIS